MSKKAHQEFHIVIFPSATSRPRRFSVKRRTVRVLLFTTVVAVVLEAFFLVQYVTRSGEIWELETLRSEAIQHRQQATTLSSAMEDLRKQLSTMREVNVRLRVMLGLDPPKVPPSPLGLGGKEETRVVSPSGAAWEARAARCRTWSRNCSRSWRGSRKKRSSRSDICTN